MNFIVPTLFEYVISTFFVSSVINTPFEKPKASVFIAAHIAVILIGPLFLLACAEVTDESL